MRFIFGMIQETDARGRRMFDRNGQRVMRNMTPIECMQQATQRMASIMKRRRSGIQVTNRGDNAIAEFVRLFTEWQEANNQALYEMYNPRGQKRNRSPSPDNDPMEVMQ